MSTAAETEVKIDQLGGDSAPVASLETRPRDTTFAQIFVQSANAGTLASTGKVGVDAGSSAGFDNYSGLPDGKATSATALATLQVGENSGFYKLDLLIGTAKAVGTFPSRHQVVDLAIQLDQRGFGPALALAPGGSLASGTVASGATQGTGPSPRGPVRVLAVCVADGKSTWLASMGLASREPRNAAKGRLRKVVYSAR
jgi:hypothetical protein